jgi:hypothetical protein
MPWKSALLGAAVAGGIVLGTHTANAQALRGFTWERGTLHGGPRFGTDDLNLGGGLNGGYTLGQGVYLGGLFNYFFGESDEFLGAEYGFDAWFLMFDGGYDFGLADPFVLRATGALGLVTVHARFCVQPPGGPEDCDSETESEFAGAFGGNAIYDAGGLTLGGELRFFFGDNFQGVWMGFNIGAVF